MKEAHQHIDFFLIGIGDAKPSHFSAEVLGVIDSAKYFSGGKRHFELVKDLLPDGFQWINIEGSMQRLADQYQSLNSQLVVFASGDPYFYGFGNTLKRLLPEAKHHSFPYFNSLQILCHRHAINYNELVSVTVHGRTWKALDTVFIEGKRLIGVLTDQHKSPQAIAQRMLQYGFDQYQMLVGQNLGSDSEITGIYSLDEAQNQKFSTLNCVLLIAEKEQAYRLGIPDEEFALLDNRAKMITKMPIRLATIQALELHQAETFWDIGFCTGSVAIEAKRLFPRINVLAIERREKCEGIIQENAERFSTPGIEILMGDFFELDLKAYPIPDGVFIGGHGGRLEEMIRILFEINPNIKLVCNAVQDSTFETFLRVSEELKMSIQTLQMQTDDNNPIRIMSAKKLTNKENYC